jgi:RNA polymerase sigma-70 factor (ECF subfamily)
MSSVSPAHSGSDPAAGANVGTGERASAPEPTDAQLMSAARAGDRSAFGQIVVRHQDRLFTAILRMVGNYEEARELAQEAFTRALMKLENFRGDAQPYTWLFRIAMNLSISRLRKDARRRVFSIDAGRNGRADDQASGLLDRASSDRTLTPDDAVERREEHQQVLAALGRLDAEYRAILVMRDVEGFDYQQMADVLDLPLGTLKSRLFRARLALREELKGYMPT